MDDREARPPVADGRSARELAWVVRRSGRWLLVDLGRDHRTLGWTIVGGGFARTRNIAWLGIRDADLPVGVDAGDLVHKALGEAGLAPRQPVFLTSTNLDAYVDVLVEAEDVVARCIATVGLSNAARVGARNTPRSQSHVGTINLLCAVSRPLTELALIEAVSIVTAARTTAVLEASVATGTEAGEGAATGTGTDCCIVAAPEIDREAGASDFAGAHAHAYAGLHTAIGEAMGRATLVAVARGVAASREAAAR